MYLGEFVLAFVFVGDGLRDAADPYSQTKKWHY
jgi:ABC-type dipeptide/oligopeptide/nickel transport system permease subunit